MRCAATRCVPPIAPQPPEVPPSCIWGDSPSALPTPRQVLFDEFSGWALKRGLEMLDDEPEEGEESLLAQHKTSAEVAAEGAKDAAAKVKAMNERDSRLKTMGAVGDAEDLAENKVRLGEGGTSWELTNTRRGLHGCAVIFMSFGGISTYAILA